MASEDKKNSENSQNKAEEPETAFKTLKIFSSFEEAEEHEMKTLASISPGQHLKNTTELIKRTFFEELKNHPEIGNRIHFE